jgi:hypothetical protein
MIQSYANGKKISFQAVDMEVSLAELEYEYLEFVCKQTLRNSDDIVREQIRSLQLTGVPSFEQWRQQATRLDRTLDKASENGLVKPEGNLAAVDVAVEVVDVEAVDVDAVSQPELPPQLEAVTPKRRGRKPGTKMPKRLPADSNGATAEAQPKRRGRPPANLTASEPIVDTPPKRRGRKPANPDGASLAVGEALPEAQPKRRGRPPSKLMAEPAVDASPKRRGRKPAAQSTIAASETTGDAAPKRRGRKPRAAQAVQAAPESIVALDLGLPESETAVLAQATLDADHSITEAQPTSDNANSAIAPGDAADFPPDDTDIEAEPQAPVSKRKPRSTSSVPVRQPRGRGRRAMR